MSKKEKLPLYLSPEKKATLERRYTEDGSRNLTGFIVKSVELDMDLSTLADCVTLDDEYLRGERRYFDALGYQDRRGDSHHYPVAQHYRVAPGAEKTALTEWIFPHPLKPGQPTRPSAASDKTESSHRLPAGDQVYPKARYRLHL